MTNTQAFLLGLAVGAATTYYLTSNKRRKKRKRPAKPVRKSVKATAAKLDDTRRAMSDALG